MNLIIFSDTNTCVVAASCTAHTNFTAETKTTPLPCEETVQKYASKTVEKYASESVYLPCYCCSAICSS